MRLITRIEMPADESNQQYNNDINTVAIRPVPQPSHYQFHLLSIYTIKSVREMLPLFVGFICCYLQ
ncbi:hypothetical protein VCRA2110O318_50069 [Vibrio crassostreae]|nr:hypothetical protein VCRA2110O318_50069 [Vibrio crassostreae]